MNRIMQDKWPWVEGTNGMRVKLMDAMSDADLLFNPGGHNVTLGALCREMGEIEYAYIQSFKTFKQDWDYHNPQVGLDRSIVQLKAWFQTLDEDLKAALTALTDEDLKKSIERPGGYTLPVDLQLDVYLQAMLIFFGKVSIFLKAMEEPMPEPIKEYIW
jgi:hypothetical protein